MGRMSVEPTSELIDADPETGTYRATYHYPSRPPSTTVAIALMEITDSDVADLDPLYEAASVDPDALDDLFAPSASGARHEGCVTFTYHDYTVTVKSHGRIVVQSPISPRATTRGR